MSRRELLAGINAILIGLIFSGGAYADWNKWLENHAWGWGDGYHSAYRWCGGCRSGCQSCSTGCEKGCGTPQPTTQATPPWPTGDAWMGLWPQPIHTAPQIPTRSIDFVGIPPSHGSAAPAAPSTRQLAPTPPSPRPLNPQLRPPTPAPPMATPPSHRSPSDNDTARGAPSPNQPFRQPPARSVSSPQSPRNWSGPFRSTSWPR